MFRKSYVHHQEDYIAHAALYIMFFMHLFKQSSRLEDVLDTGWLTLHNCLTLHNYITMYRKRKIHLALYPQKNFKMSSSRLRLGPFTKYV
jgi:hypothetical protein